MSSNWLYSAIWLGAMGLNHLLALQQERDKITEKHLSHFDLGRNLVELKASTKYSWLYQTIVLSLWYESFLYRKQRKKSYKFTTDADYALDSRGEDVRLGTRCFFALLRSIESKRR